MRWAVVSDIHGNLPALEAVIADAADVDGWLNLGDILSGPLWPRETAHFLMQQDWPTIAGNHERQLLTLARDRMGPTDAFTIDTLTPAQVRWLAALPPTMAPAAGLLCVHGAPGKDLQYLLETVTPQGVRAATADEIGQRLGGVRSPLLLCGHTHVPRDVALDPMRIVNPGSVGLQAYDDGHPWPHLIENGSPRARYALIENANGAWQVTLREVDYDHEAAARRAEGNGRGDWADALRTGRVGRTEADVRPASRPAPG